MIIRFHLQLLSVIFLWDCGKELGQGRGAKLALVAILLTLLVQFAGTGYPYVRVQAGVSVDAYTNIRYGHPTDANGNTVVDDNHVHNAGEAHHKLIAFDQLFGGPANHRYCYYGISEFEGVTVNYNNK